MVFPQGPWTPILLAEAISKIEANREGIDLRTVQLWFQDNDKGVSADNIRWLARILGCDDPEATSAWQAALSAAQARLTTRRRQTASRKDRTSQTSEEDAEPPAVDGRHPHLLQTPDGQVRAATVGRPWASRGGPRRFLPAGPLWTFRPPSLPVPSRLGSCPTSSGSTASCTSVTTGSPSRSGSFGPRTGPSSSWSSCHSSCIRRRVAGLLEERGPLKPPRRPRQGGERCRVDAPSRGVVHHVLGGPPDLPGVRGRPSMGRHPLDPVAAWRRRLRHRLGSLAILRPDTHLRAAGRRVHRSGLPVHVLCFYLFFAGLILLYTLAHDCWELDRASGGQIGRGPRHEASTVGVRVMRGIFRCTVSGLLVAVCMKLQSSYVTTSAEASGVGW